MNAHQRRIKARKPHTVIDLEATPFASFWENFKAGIPVGQVSFVSVRPRGQSLSTGRAGGVPLVKVLKERPIANPCRDLVYNMDFTKIEERVIEHIEEPPVAGKGIDCHRATAAKMFKVAYDDVTPEQRAAGKDANYLGYFQATYGNRS